MAIAMFVVAIFVILFALFAVVVNDNDARSANTLALIAICLTFVLCVLAIINLGLSI